MARKGATQRENPGRGSGNVPSAGTPAAASRATPRGGASARTTAAAARRITLALYAVLALDAVLAMVILYIHALLRTTQGAYTSFCNVNARVNCDAVLASPYGTLFGVPVAVWSLLTCGVLAALLAWRGQLPVARRPQATLPLVGLAMWALVFSLYMAVIATFAIGAFCLLCAAHYVLIAVVAILAWRLARIDAAAAGSPLGVQRALLGGSAIAIALAALAALQFMVAPASLAHLTPDEVRERDPDFYKWYTTRPVVDTLPTPAHAKGPPDAPVTIVEFSDFECGYCAKAFRDLRDVERQHHGNLRIVFHHFPLDSDCNPHTRSRMHESACLAAIAAECAAREGKFWEYHDRLFGDQDRLERDALIATAVDIGVDRAAFTACLDDPASRARVLADAEAGARLGVKSTPTLFINGRAVEGALERSAYEYAIAMERRK